MSWNYNKSWHALGNSAWQELEPYRDWLDSQRSVVNVDSLNIRELFTGMASLAGCK